MRLYSNTKSPSLTLRACQELLASGDDRAFYSLSSRLRPVMDSG